MRWWLINFELQDCSKFLKIFSFIKNVMKSCTIYEAVGKLKFWTGESYTSRQSMPCQSGGRERELMPLSVSIYQD